MDGPINWFLFFANSYQWRVAKKRFYHRGRTGRFALFKFVSCMARISGVVVWADLRRSHFSFLRQVAFILQIPKLGSNARPAFVRLLKTYAICFFALVIIYWIDQIPKDLKSVESRTYKHAFELDTKQADILNANAQPAIEFFI